MFCRNCGKEIPNNINFCNYCGASQGNRSVQNTQSGSGAYGQQDSTVYSQPGHTAPSSPGRKKHSVKKKVGIVLICLQIIAFIAGISNGVFWGMLEPGLGGFYKLFGFFLWEL